MDEDGFLTSVEEYIFEAEDAKIRAERMRVAIAVRDLPDRNGPTLRKWRLKLVEHIVTTIKDELRQRYGEEVETSGEKAFFTGQRWNPVKFYKRSWQDADGRIPVFYAIDCDKHSFYDVYYGISKETEDWPYDGVNVPKALEGVTGDGFRTSQHWVGWRWFADPWGGMSMDEFLVALAAAGEGGLTDLARRHYAKPFMTMVDQTIEVVDAYNREIVGGSRV